MKNAFISATTHVTYNTDINMTLLGQASSCNRHFSSLYLKSSTFTSPNYPLPYSDDVTCKYTFVGNAKERVQIIFNDLYLAHPALKEDQTNIECEDVDSVTIRTVVDKELLDLGRYCGNQKTHQLMSSDISMEVLFISKSRITNVEYRGFNASFHFVTDFGITTGEQDVEMGCRFVYRSEKASSGTFVSPNFPGFYPRNADCHYIFQGKENEKVFITFQNIDVEGVWPGCEEGTQSDYVEFSNFNVDLLDRKMGRLCDVKDGPRYVHSDGNFFRVTFKSNSLYDGTGFEALYQFRKSDGSFK